MLVIDPGSIFSDPDEKFNNYPLIIPGTTNNLVKSNILFLSIDFEL